MCNSRIHTLSTDTRFSLSFQDHFLVLQLTLSRVGLKTLCWIRGLFSLAPQGCWHHCAKMVYCVRGSLSLSVRPYLASPIRNLSIHQYQLALPIHNPSCQWCPLVNTPTPTPGPPAADHAAIWSSNANCGLPNMTTSPTCQQDAVHDPVTCSYCIIFDLTPSKGKFVDVKSTLCRALVLWVLF